MTRVLLVRLSALGDVVQTLGAVQALADGRPDLELHFAVQRPYLALLRGLPLASTLALDRGGGVGAWWRLRRSLRRLRPRVALDLQGNWKSALACRISGAPQRIGAGGPWRQEPRSRLLLTDTVAVPGPRHPGLVAHAVVRALAPDAPIRLPRLVATAAEVAAAADSIAASGIDPTRPFRVLVPGGPDDPRSLHGPRVAREAAASTHPVLCLLGPAESGVALPAALPVLRQPPGALQQLIGLGGLLARVGGDAIGPDQGPVHVLAACGVRTTVLFGPQDPLRTAPPAARALRHPHPPDCAPCSRRRCRHVDGPVCMDFAADEGSEVPRADWLPPLGP